jgi:hypothetical protein
MRKVALKRFLFPILSLSLGLLFLAACGETGSNTTGIPTAGGEDVEGPTTPLPEDPGNTTSGIPNLSKSAVINLEDKINYSDLIAIAGNVVTPIVGDPRVLLKITNTRSEKVNGTLLLAFEDKLGFWGADMNSVADTGVNTSSALDIIFSDNALTVRITASRLGEILLSHIHYRVRQSGETQCLPASCYITFGGIKYEVPFGSQWCPIPKPDTAGICRSYMTTTQAAVKKLGTFSSKYTDIAVLPEGN